MNIHAAARKRLSRARQLVRDDILKRFGDFARSSAPSAAFTAAVITTLGMASKPAAAAGATAIGTATLGGSLAGKGLAGVVGMGGVIGGSLLHYLTHGPHKPHPEHYDQDNKKQGGA